MICDKRSTSKKDKSEEQKQTDKTASSPRILPVQITDGLPIQTSGQVKPVSKVEVSPGEFSGLCDGNIRKYWGWQQSKVKYPVLKSAFQKATDFLVEKGSETGKSG